ncbi:energy-coupling factor ABC transporter ATP-binding protein [Dissulfuribacter thermophilus]|uniref:energy-coupling factor ABC transporter ATP-binding protein n=1 Tax=Dissulfuribacter thermophilus TaxID=1156395 RepID=UPI00082EDF80|nr:ABC transporter ATP-binding protein [Dissulfuribacter thermophilus]
MNRLIELKDIYFAYSNGESIFQGLDFTLNEGERILLKGPNGAGKTTLFNLILGLLTPQKGKVILFGKQCVKDKDFKVPRQKIGFLFQDSDHQLFCPTVLEDVCFGPLNQGLNSTDAIKKAEEILYMLGVSHLAHRPSYRLSGGEKRLVALATILVMEPDVLLLDEPFNALDMRAKKRIEEVLTNIKIRAMILVSHYEKLPKGLISKEAFLRKNEILVQDVVIKGNSIKKVVPFPG